MMTPNLLGKIEEHATHYYGCKNREEFLKKMRARTMVMTSILKAQNKRMEVTPEMLARRCTL